MQSRVPAGASTSQPQVSTPQRPSQAWRAQTTRSPADPSVLQKRPRTPSPPPTHAIASGRPTTPKQRRIEGESGTRTRTTTPALTPSQRAARQAEIERGLAEGKKLSRIASIQEALSAVKTSSQAPSGTPPSGSLAPPQASPAGSSRIAIIEAALHDSRHHHSDLPPSPSPSSASQARALPMAPSRPPQSTQSDAGYSISSEIEDAELDDLEDKAIQTDPYDDEESIIEDFFQSAPASALGSPVVYATALSSASADVGSGSSRPSMSRMPDSEPERGSWLPAPPPLTPGRGRSMRTSTPGGNEGGMLLTPPGTSQTGYRSASEHGRFGGRHGAPQSPSPSPAKGKGREMPRSPSWGMGSPQWQMIQDDPVRVQCCVVDCMRGSDASLCFGRAVLLVVCFRASYGHAGEPIPRACARPWWGYPRIDHLGRRNLGQCGVAVGAALRRRYRVTSRSPRERSGIRAEAGKKRAGSIE